MKKLFGIIFLTILIQGNESYFNKALGKDTINVRAVVVNIETGNKYQDNGPTYSTAFDYATKQCRKDNGSMKICKQFSMTTYYSDGSFEKYDFPINVAEKLNKKDYVIAIVTHIDSFELFESPPMETKNTAEYMALEVCKLSSAGKKNPSGCKLKEFIISENGKKFVEKPNKGKPKKTPDDDKIVPAGSGSGFFVSKDGHAITNYHVIEGCDINKLTFKGSQTEVKVLAVDKVNDIAILKSNAKPDVIFPVSNEDVSLLEDVIVAGFPLGKQISSAIKTHKGVVTALAGAGDNYSFFQTDAAINQGNSGGPIINQKGNVVGIAVATWVEEGVQGVHFGIKSSTLKTFASANGLSFASPNYRELSNKDLGKLITKGTVYVECHMTVAKIKKMIAQAENRKAFFKEHK